MLRSELSTLGYVMYVLECWVLSRQRRLLWQGLPAVFLGLLAVILAVVAWDARPERLKWYRGQAREAVEANDHARTLICCERLLESASDRKEALYQIALTSEQMGQRGRAWELMRSLASLKGEEDSFGPAHVEVARRLLGVPRPDAERLRLAELHLLQAIRPPMRPDTGQAHLLLGELYMNLGRLDAALNQLSLADGVPTARLRLAQLAVLQGRKKDAEALANEVVAEHREKLREEPIHDANRLLLAEALTFLERFREAEAVVREAPGTGPTTPLLRQALSGVYLAWLDVLTRNKESKAAERLEVAQAALQHDPKDSRVLARLWALADEVKDDSLRTLLREHLAAGKNPALTNFLLGMDAWKRGEQAEARSHLEQAYRAGPGIALVANNLAWMLAHASPPQLERALNLIDGVVRQYPDDARFHGTRGHVLAKLGRWTEALPELVASLPAYGDEPVLHEVLAEAYKRLGPAAMAEKHRKTLETLRKKAASKTPSKREETGKKK